MADYPMSSRPAFLHPAEYHLTTWYLSVRPEIEPEHLLDPKFWALISRRMKRFERVIVDCEDLSWTAELIVLEANTTGAQMVFKEFVDLTEAKQGSLDRNAGESYKVDYVSPSEKWRVVRVSDGTEMVRGLGKKQAAEWVEDRARIGA